MTTTKTLGRAGGYLPLDRIPSETRYRVTTETEEEGRALYRALGLHMATELRNITWDEKDAAYALLRRIEHIGPEDLEPAAKTVRIALDAATEIGMEHAQLRCALEALVCSMQRAYASASDLPEIVRDPLLRADALLRELDAKGPRLDDEQPEPPEPAAG